MSTDAQKRASTNYNRKQDNIMVRPNKEEGATIRAAAAAAGKSVQGYVLEAVREKMERKRARGVPAGGTCTSVPAVSPAGEGTGAGVMVFPEGSPDGDISSRFILQWGPDFQTALTDSGQSAEEYVTQAVRERVERESKPPIPQWIVERYPGERWPVLKAVRAIQGNMNAQRILHRSMTQEQQAEWDKEFRRELDEERREGAGQDTQKPTCNLPLD